RDNSQDTNFQPPSCAAWELGAGPCRGTTPKTPTSNLQVVLLGSWELEVGSWSLQRDNSQDTNFQPPKSCCLGVGSWQLEVVLVAKRRRMLDACARASLLPSSPPSGPRRRRSRHRRPSSGAAHGWSRSTWSSTTSTGSPSRISRRKTSPCSSTGSRRRSV